MACSDICLDKGALRKVLPQDLSNLKEMSGETTSAIRKDGAGGTIGGLVEAGGHQSPASTAGPGNTVPNTLGMTGHAIVEPRRPCGGRASPSVFGPGSRWRSFPISDTMLVLRHNDTPSERHLLPVLFRDHIQSIVLRCSGSTRHACCTGRVRAVFENDRFHTATRSNKNRSYKPSSVDGDWPVLPAVLLG